ncbi:MAG: hypothetical protein WAZ12_00440 [Candidatus Absconditicoccaceae bacterium]
MNISKINELFEPLSEEDLKWYYEQRKKEKINHIDIKKKQRINESIKDDFDLTKDQIYQELILEYENVKNMEGGFEPLSEEDVEWYYEQRKKEKINYIDIKKKQRINESIKDGFDLTKDQIYQELIIEEHLDNVSKNENSKEAFDFGKIYDKQYRENYREAYEKNNILNLDYIINNEVEENIDHLVEINIYPGSEQTILTDLVKKHPECQIIVNQEKISSLATILKRFNLKGFKAEDLIKYLLVKYPEFQNTYERVCLRSPISALQQINVEYFVNNRMLKFPELKRNDIKFKNYLPSTRLREIKSQYFVNVLIKKHPELNPVADRFKDWEPSARLKELKAQYFVNVWLKAHPEFEKIADKLKDSQPSIVNNFMKFNNG